MRKAAVAVFIAVFAVCMFHFYYAEDHCPVHCPSKGGQLGHVHHHHAGASVCLCFLSSLFSPETDDVVMAGDFLAAVALPADGCVLAMLSADIAHPPKSSLA
jgi:hypothetical protein